MNHPKPMPLEGTVLKAVKIRDGIIVDPDVRPGDEIQWETIAEVKGPWLVLRFIPYIVLEI